MTLTSIEATNFKGADFQYDLSPAVAIVGPNMKGKTRIVQAIRLALGGYLPECGKTAKATWELSSGPEMRVRCDVETGVEGGGNIKRRFFLQGTTVKEEHSMRPSVLDTFANLPLLNAEAYFAMTDTERTTYVFERMTLPDSYTTAEIVAELERISFGEEHSEQIQEAKAEIIKKAHRHFIGRVGMTMQEGLAKAIEELRNLFTFWNARAKSTQGAVTTLAELKLREPTVAAAAQGTAEAISKARQTLDDLIAEKGKLEAKQEEAERVATRMALIRKQLELPREDRDKQIPRLQANITSAKSKLAPKLVLSAPARKNIADALESVRADRAKAGAQVAQCGVIILAARKRLDELAGLTACPYCQSAGTDWKSILRATIEREIAQAEAAQEIEATASDRANKAVNEMMSTLEVSDNAQMENQRLARSIETWETEIALNRGAAASDDARRTALKEELTALEERHYIVDVAQQLSVNADKRQDASDAINVATVKQDAEARLQQELKLAAQAEIEHQEAAAHVKVVKAIATVLKERREAMITEAFTGLLKIANQIVGGILPSHLDLHENTVGRWVGAKFIPHRVFSGTEKALTYIAIAVALSSTAPLKLVILDEFGRLDRDNQVRVLANLWGRIVDKTIDQFIVIGTGLPGARPAELQIIEVNS